MAPLHQTKPELPHAAFEFFRMDDGYGDPDSAAGVAKGTEAFVGTNSFSRFFIPALEEECLSAAAHRPAVAVHFREKLLIFGKKRDPGWKKIPHRQTFEYLSVYRPRLTSFSI